ncbi:D-cysteine desulfhydrase family protein [Actinomadura geliboluensis]|uniref:D-cysteine desulfhydrase family protein n=1 Tax=Actinomadura geliboluensis TaxID=882440 RepID=UPI00368F5E75
MTTSGEGRRTDGSGHEQPIAPDRVPLALLPTPLVPLTRLSEHLGGPPIWMKRDDLTGLALGGNKARKLEYLLAEALRAGADTLITAGGPQSNHVVQTAAAAARHGLACHVVLGGKEPGLNEGNLLLDVLHGAHLHWTDEGPPFTDSLGALQAELMAAGTRPHLIPFGGSSATGALGFERAAEELALQTTAVRETGATVVVASGSGGTQAGLVRGGRTAWAPGSRTIGISVLHPAGTLRRIVGRLLSEAGEPADLAEDIDVRDEYLGGGYGVVGPLEVDAIRLVARLEGIVLDPVYTGRAMGGLLDLVRTGQVDSTRPVVFWHTGGQGGLFGKTSDLNVHLPLTGMQ